MTVDSAPEPSEVRNLLIRGLNARVHASVMRRTPFLSTKAANDLAEDVCENVASFLTQVLAHNKH